MRVEIVSSLACGSQHSCCPLLPRDHRIHGADSTRHSARYRRYSSVKRWISRASITSASRNIPPKWSLNLRNSGTVSDVLQVYKSVPDAIRMRGGHLDIDLLQSSLYKVAKFISCRCPLSAEETACILDIVCHLAHELSESGVTAHVASARCISLTMWSCVKLSEMGGGDMSAACSDLMASCLWRLTSNQCGKVAQLSTEGVGMVYWSLARSKSLSQDESLVSAVAKAAKMRCICLLDSMDIRTIAIVSWSIAKLDCVDRAFHDNGKTTEIFFRLMVDRVRKSFSECNALDLANISWSISRCYPGKYSKFFFALEAYLMESPDLLATFEAQNLSNISWAFAESGNGGERLFDSFASIAVSRQNQLKGEEIASLLWAFASRGHLPPQALLRAIHRRCVYSNGNQVKGTSLFNQMSTQTKANLVWAYARLKVFDAGIFEIVGTSAINDSDSFKQFELVNILWSFASVGLSMYDDGFHGSSGFSKTNPQYNAIDAQRMGILSSRLADKLSKKLFAEFKSPDFGSTYLDFTHQNLSLIVWSLSLLRYYFPIEFEELLTYVLEKINWADNSAHINNIDRSQIYQVYMLHALRFGMGRSTPAGTECSSILYPIGSIDACKSTYTELSRSHLLFQSSFHSDVARILNRLGVSTEMEYVTEEGLVIDLAIPERKIAIEVNGPSHFVTCLDLKGTLPELFSQRRTLDGSSRLKHILLRGLGWHVYSISHFEWELLKGSQERTQYLHSLLNVGSS